jgi:hypothetical protein
MRFVMLLIEQGAMGDGWAREVGFAAARLPSDAPNLCPLRWGVRAIVRFPPGV